MPGHGPKPTLECDPAQTLHFIEQQVNVFNTAETAQEAPPLKCLLGYSLGARAALLYAIQHSVYIDALILISGNAGIREQGEREQRTIKDQTLAAKIEKEGLKQFIDYWQQQPIIRSQVNIRADWRKEMLENRQKNTTAGLSQSLRQFGQGAYPNIWPDLHKITCPTLIISGEQDSKYCQIATEMQKKIPYATIRTIPQAGHMPHLEQPQLSARAIDDFILQIR